MITNFLIRFQGLMFSNQLFIIIIILYFTLITIVFFQHNLWISTDHFIVLGLVAAVLIGRGKHFLKDWLPFIIMFLGYEALHGINPEITGAPVNISNVIAWERFLFQSIPTIELQKLFFNSQTITWFDVYLSITYMSHFIGFLFFGFILWYKKHIMFHRFTHTILILSYSAFVTYIFFPVMPPWMASEKKYLPKIERIMYQTTPIYTSPGPQVPTIYNIFSTNKTAAMPSLHAAYPTVIFLFSLAIKNPWFIFLSGTYMLSVWLSVVYLGEHYVVDVIGAIIYAVIAFLIVMKIFKAKPLPINLKN